MQGDHGNCKRSTGKEGHYGGSLCTCRCFGNPNYKHPFVIECEHGVNIEDYCKSCHAEFEINIVKKKRRTE